MFSYLDAANASVLKYADFVKLCQESHTNLPKLDDALSKVSQKSCQIAAKSQISGRAGSCRTSQSKCKSLAQQNTTPQPNEAKIVSLKEFLNKKDQDSAALNFYNQGELQKTFGVSSKVLNESGNPFAKINEGTFESIIQNSYQGSTREEKAKSVKKDSRRSTNA